MFSIFCFRKSCRLRDNVGKIGVARQAADNMAHARCMMDKPGYMRASTWPRPCIHTHVQARARAHTLLLQRQQLFHEQASMLRYT